MEQFDGRTLSNEVEGLLTLNRKDVVRMKKKMKGLSVETNSQKKIENLQRVAWQKKLKPGQHTARGAVSRGRTGRGGA